MTLTKFQENLKRNLKGQMLPKCYADDTHNVTHNITHNVTHNVTHNGKEGCGVLFMIKNGSGIIICGQKRLDGNQFLCKRCLKEFIRLLKEKIDETPTHFHSSFMQKKATENAYKTKELIKKEIDKLVGDKIC
jgi:hypothetical protein